MHVLASSKKLLLFTVTKKEFQNLLRAKFAQKKGCGGFMDVTQAWYEPKPGEVPINAKLFLDSYEMNEEQTLSPKIEYKIQYEAQVNAMLKQINPQMMWNNLTTLTNYHNRQADSDTGVAASEWIKAQVEKMAKDNNRDDIHVYTIKTGPKHENPNVFIPSFKQNSVIAKIGTGDGPGIVLGAHMDTTAMFESRQPGADDDGSGTATALETIRTLIYSGVKFNKPIYFAWYSAEEEGLIGSQYVVAQFKKENIKVDAVLHFDMTGYAYRNDPTMWLVSDHTNKALTSFLETLLKTYVKQPIKYTSCGYACSDHATWTKNGFPAAICFESSMQNMNKSIHSSRDTMEKLSLAHMTDYLKLGVAFAVELAEPKS